MLRLESRPHDRAAQLRAVRAEIGLAKKSGYVAALAGIPVAELSALVAAGIRLSPRPAAALPARLAARRAQLGCVLEHPSKLEKRLPL